MSRSSVLDPVKNYKKKLFYRIADVAEIAGVEPYVLRYWETRFSKLKPERLDSDERRYRQKDVDLVLKIRRLLYEEKFTIEGAAKQLSGSRKTTSAPATPPTETTPEPVAIPVTPLRQIKLELAAIKEELSALRGG